MRPPRTWGGQMLKVRLGGVQQERKGLQRFLIRDDHDNHINRSGERVS